MTPQLVEIMGEDLVEKVRYCRSFNECANTNLMAVLELILAASAKSHLPQTELSLILWMGSRSVL